MTARYSARRTHMTTCSTFTGISGFKFPIKHSCINVNGVKSIQGILICAKSLFSNLKQFILYVHLLLIYYLCKAIAHWFTFMNGINFVSYFHGLNRFNALYLNPCIIWNTVHNQNPQWFLSYQMTKETIKWL